MLILTRRQGERIFIMDEDVNEIKLCITVNSINGGQVSIGIDADKSYTILREEVFLRSMQSHRDIEQDYEGSEDAA